MNKLKPYKHRDNQDSKSLSNLVKCQRIRQMIKRSTQITKTKNLPLKPIKKTMTQLKKKRRKLSKRIRMSK